MSILDDVKNHSPEEKRARLVGGATGVLYDIFNFQPWMINIHDLVTSLSKKCRWNGMLNTTEIYSIAQHSVHVSDYMGSRPQDRLAGLLHDASEGFMIDMITPMKRVFPDFRVVENKMQDAIYAHFGVNMTPERLELLHWADDHLLHLEANQFGRKIYRKGTSHKLSDEIADFRILNCEDAKSLWIDTFNNIMSEILSE
jgi:hypothetical protein